MPIGFWISIVVAGTAFGLLCRLLVREAKADAASERIDELLFELAEIEKEENRKAWAERNEALAKRNKAMNERNAAMEDWIRRR